MTSDLVLTRVWQNGLLAGTTQGMEAFKNRYSKKTISEMALELARHDKKFEAKSFAKEAAKNITKLEMKARVVQIAESLNSHLNHSYKKNIQILLKSLSNNNGEGIENFILWPYTYYIETYGIDDFDTSMHALYHITQKFTSEFGVRPFFNRYPAETYTLFKEWVQDPSEHVRRWISEGTRPNLPWGMKISHLEKNLKKNIMLLEKLKNDDSVYVRTSVANHMNDISWLDPDLVIKTLTKWQKAKTPEMSRLIKRALRNLVKQGHPGALKLLGFDSKIKSSVSALQLSVQKIKEGESFDLSFSLTNKEAQKKSFMVDYNIHYPKANGSLSKKTFKLKALDLTPKASASLTKKVSFKKVTTRKHYPGVHKIEIQVNGLVKAQTEFELI